MSAKATQYLDQLDRARCDGNWAAVPELVRKVRKHAPDRSCLALTAETECAISNATAAALAPNNSRPDAAASPPKDLEVSTKLTRLVDAMEMETKHAEDRFQAQVCIGWLHWVVAEYGLALTRLPKSLEQEDTNLDPAEMMSEWTTVCALKAAYLRANCLTRNYKKQEALDAFHAGLPALTRVWSGLGVRKQLSYWSELYLTEFCMLSSEAVQDGEVTLDRPNSLACFRSWVRFWEAMGTPVSGGFGFRGSVPRRRVWGEYYIALSRVLEEDLPYPTGHLPKIISDMSARAQLRVELKTAEAAYQALLLAETTFPRADEHRDEVEAFARLVVRNWSILCGRGWKEQDLGPGGRNSLSRGVLDTLYGAATKTYHSTSILRSLFLVHVGVAEFDIAFKAFDSYMDIIKKGKARVDKTGHPEPSLDDDGTVLETMSQAIVALCQYGYASMAEKARQLGAELEDWLARLPQFKAEENGTPAATDATAKSELHPPVPGHIVALAWQAIGLSQAHWSRVTYEASSRTEIQSRAVRCLRRSMAPDFGRSKDISGFFALGILLAERRELTAAIEVVRAGLITSKGQEDHYHLLYGPYWKERSLISLWHLLALLLSARQDYVMAARACEGAFEQFKDPSILFGKEDPIFKSEHLNDSEKKTAAAEERNGLVDNMDDTEKEGILEVKMTQLALIELLEGPDVAVNASYELLALFTRLFGNMAAQPTLNPPKINEPPKTSGTLRSFRGSIFGGKTDKDRSRPPTRQPTNLTEKSVASLRPATSHTTASTTPTIQVTGENGTPTPQRRSESRRRNSLRKRDRSVSRNRVSSASAVSVGRPTTSDGDAFFTPPADTEQVDFFTYSSKRSPQSSSSFRRKTLPTLNSFLSNTSRSTDYSELAADATHASTNLLPLIQFPKEKERMRRTTILVRVWLMIAGFYRRADMFGDGKGAVAEAQKLVQVLETELSREPSSTGSLRSVPWAESKSIEDLWGDVYSEQGLLSSARNELYTARSEFESALTHCPNHPTATVGLSNILLDIYTEKLKPKPAIPGLDDTKTPESSQNSAKLPIYSVAKETGLLPSIPLGLGPHTSKKTAGSRDASYNNASTDISNAGPGGEQPDSHTDDGHAPPYKATRLPLADRLAARDRAYALLSGLTRQGSSWNSPDAWFALARAHEESGQIEKAKEVLWWCIELEESRAVRDWRCLGNGGYVL